MVYELTKALYTRYIRVQEDGCKIWTGPRYLSRDKKYRHKTRGPYGKVYLNNKLWEEVKHLDPQRKSRNISAHKLAYMLKNGSLMPEWRLIHTCGNTLCVSPRHMEVINKRNSASFLTRNKKKTHCPKGHAYSEANTHVVKGRRYCRACQKIRDLGRKR